MPHIQVPEGVPGIRSLVMFPPRNRQAFIRISPVFIKGESPLSEAERELIAAYVSARNDTKFCTMSHAAAARNLYGDDKNLVDDVLKGMQHSQVSDKLKALLHIAGKVQVLGKEVAPEDIQAARLLGANDREIHDTVLIAATFSMYNRYVDGLASFTPDDPNEYEEMGKEWQKRDIRHHTNKIKPPLCLTSM
jgi:uncharacterized peroxidase-related enzyme